MANSVPYKFTHQLLVRGIAKANFYGSDEDAVKSATFQRELMMAATVEDEIPLTAADFRLRPYRVSFKPGKSNVRTKWQPSTPPHPAEAPAAAPTKAKARTKKAKAE